MHGTHVVYWLMLPEGLRTLCRSRVRPSDEMPCREQSISSASSQSPVVAARVRRASVQAMRLKLYCNRYGHFKDALVCSVSCVYRTRCNDFALFYDERRAEVDALVSDYYDARREQQGRKPDTAAHDSTLAHITPVARPEELRKLIRLEVLREMAEAFYIWIDKEDRAELLETVEVLRRAERGQKAKSIYKVSQEMELRFQLVPRKRIDKAKRVAAVESERAEARRTRRPNARPNAPAPVPFPTPVASDDAEREAPVPRRARARAGR
jgi:hypothetical protein